MALKEYKPGTTFTGIMGRTFEVSQPAWPQPLRAAQGAPNVLFIVLDDVGFAQLGCFGSPIRTPNIDALAADGLRYANMHTAALCSPTRACLLTGRNHHSNHMASITEVSMGYPGYDGYIPFENGFLSEILLQHGYNTYCVGKWHLTPAEATSPAGPFERWPLGRGFERYYGFLGAETNQYYPDLVRDNAQVEPEKRPEQGYHLTEDLADKAIGMIADAKQVAPSKPFFLYFAPGAMHAPHHVPKEWPDRYKGAFDGGWDAYREAAFARQKEMGIVPEDTVLSRHDPDVPDWKSLPPHEQRLYARMMEVFAGFLEHTDHHIGRLIKFLKEIGEYDNTMIMLVSDNGASPEGGPTGSINENDFFNNVKDSLENALEAIDEIGGPNHYNHYPWGWTHAGNTPFRRWKRETYRGGISDPLIVSWPKGMKTRGEVRHQYVHAIDLLPTVLEALGLETPTKIRGVAQAPVEGVSFADSFDEANAPDRHLTQYFEMIGHRSLYHDGWRAVCPWPGQSFIESGRFFGAPLNHDELVALDADGWELYHVAEDFAETRNLAGDPAHRGRLIEMINQWYVEAGKYNVLPIDSRTHAKLMTERPQITPFRESFTYYPDTQAIAGSVAPRIFNRSYAVVADVVVPEGGAEGVLLSYGGSEGGISFYLKDGKPHFVHNYLARNYFTAASAEVAPAGRRKLAFVFEVTGQPDMAKGEGAPGTGYLFIDDREVGRVEMPFTTPVTFGLGGTVKCGANSGSPVTPEYKTPFKFTGTIKTVSVEVIGATVIDRIAYLKEMMARQ